MPVQNLPAHDKERQQICQPLFCYESGEGGKIKQGQTFHLFFVFPQKGAFLDEDLFVVKCWPEKEQQPHLLEGG